MRVEITFINYLRPPYCRAEIYEIYAGRVERCPKWVTVSMPTGQTERRTDARLLHYAFRQRKKHDSMPITVCLACRRSRRPSIR